MLKRRLREKLWRSIESSKFESKWSETISSRSIAVHSRVLRWDGTALLVAKVMNWEQKIVGLDEMDGAR